MKQDLHWWRTGTRLFLWKRRGFCGFWSCFRRLFAFVGIGALATLGIAFSPNGGTGTKVTEIIRVPAAGSRLAITFDAGGDCDGLGELLDALSAAKVRSTFFITGRWASTYPEWVRAIHARGHEIGNHSWSHPDLTRLDDEGIRGEILRTDRLLRKLAGEGISPFFRAPYGARNSRTLGVVQAAGYQSIYWSLDTLDSDPPPKEAQYLIKRVTGRSDGELQGAIVLMHVGEPATVSALPVILENLRSRKFRALTVSALMARGSP